MVHKGAMTHLMLFRRLLISLLFILPCMVAAAKSTCSFSCPPMDKLSQSLVKCPHAVGFDSFYSIFECIYLSSNPDLPDPTCSYYKDTGLQALGSIYDHCMPIAVPCPTSDEEFSQSGPPLFSSQDRDEVPSWVEIGRYHLYLKEHNQ